MFYRLIRQIGFYFTVSLSFMLVMITLFSVFYHYTEGLSWLDSFYFTVITTRTIGFGDISPGSAAGKIGTIFNALLPATVFLGTSLLILEALMKNLEEKWKRYRMRSNVNHEIVVGDPETIDSIVTEYDLLGKKFVVISTAGLDTLPPQLVKHLNETNFLKGDPTNDEVLKQAGIEAAHSIVIATPDDNINMYTLVTAKSLSPGIQAVVRVNRRETESKFRSVGADIILPASTVLGRMLSEAALSPISHNFLVALHTRTIDPFFEETAAGPGEAGRPVRDAFPGSIAVFRNGEYIYDLVDVITEPGDVILSIKLKYSTRPVSTN